MFSSSARVTSEVCAAGMHFLSLLLHPRARAQENEDEQGRRFAALCFARAVHSFSSARTLQPEFYLFY